jgi:hypothetical protein
MNFTPRIGLAIFLAGILAVVATNTWPDFNQATQTLGQTDSRNYRAIAQAAPGLPEQSVAYHRAQRFWIHWAIGVMARGSGLHVDVMFRCVTLLLIAGIAWSLWRIVQLVGPPIEWQTAIALAWAFDPYCLRYFLAVPWMVADLLFVLGFSIVVLGMLRSKIGLVAGGLIIAAIGRQTALVCMLAVWAVILWRGRITKATRASDIFLLALASVVIIAIYWAGGRYAAATGAIAYNIQHLSGLAAWLLSDGANKAGRLIEFGLRAIVSQGAALPLLFVLFVKLPRPWPPQIWIVALLVVSVWVQPILAGPEITTKNISRLGSLGYVGLLAMAAQAARDAGTRLAPWAFWSIAVAAFLGSFHHQWSWPGRLFLESPERFGVLLASTSILVGIAAFFGSRSRNSMHSAASAPR